MTRYYIQRPDGQELLPECFEPDTERCVEIDGMTWMRLFGACQALMCPTRFYRVTHTQAKWIVAEILGECPKGMPGTANKGSKFRDGGPEAIYKWLGLSSIIHRRGGEGCITNRDATFLYKE